jgi:spore maturation protein CgeB
MPLESDNVNMKCMTGASNKPFDYMAAGIPMLVSDLPEWRSMFVEPGYARACKPRCPESIAEAIGWYLSHPKQRELAGEEAQRKIEDEWNYESEFSYLKAVILNRRKNR